MENKQKTLRKKLSFKVNDDHCKVDPEIKNYDKKEPTNKKGKNKRKTCNKTSTRIVHIFNFQNSALFTKAAAAVVVVVVEVFIAAITAAILSLTWPRGE